jgi:hypothetical protein
MLLERSPNNLTPATERMPPDAEPRATPYANHYGECFGDQELHRSGARTLSLSGLCCTARVTARKLNAKTISSVSAKIGPKSDPAAAPKFPDDQRVGRVPTARKRPREGKRFRDDGAGTGQCRASRAFLLLREHGVANPRQTGVAYHMPAGQPVDPPEGLQQIPTGSVAHL